MMINPGSTDLAGLFALLTAVSDPKAAKASLQEIADASAAYQKSIDDSRTELKALRDEVDAKKAEADSVLANAEDIRDTNFKDYSVRKKQLDDQDAFLSKRDVICQQMEASLNGREVDVKAHESIVAAREAAVTQREIEVQKLSDYAEALKTDYTTKMANLQSMLGTNYVMKADPMFFGADMA